MPTPDQNTEPALRTLPERELAVSTKLLSNVEKALAMGNDPRQAIDNLEKFNCAVLTGLRIEETRLEFYGQARRRNPALTATEVSNTAIPQ